MNKPKGKRPGMNMGVLKRAVGMLFEFFPVLAPLTMCCILFT